MKRVFTFLAILGLIASQLTTFAEARGSHHHHGCRAGRHMDYGSNSCVKDHK